MVPAGVVAGGKANDCEHAGVVPGGCAADNSETTGSEAVGGEAAGVEAASGQVAGGEAAARQYNTRGGTKPIDRFDRSEYTWQPSEYEQGRLGSRHAKTRDVSYIEATQKLEKMGLQAEAWLHEVRRIVTQMDIILDEMPPEHAVAARALQSALIEMVDEAEDEGEEGNLCEPCDVEAPAESSAPTEAERVAAAYFQEVTEAVEWSTEGAPPSPPLAVLRASHNGHAGGLLLTRFELLWIAAGSHLSEAQLRVPLRQERL